eukprot:PITA_33682
MITNVYGPQKQANKLKLFTSVEDLRARHPILPWIVAGDFNMIRSLSEKKGGTRQLSRDSMAFQNFIMNMGLVDTETINGTFTWNNKRGGASQVASKLDRFIISEDLLLTGPAITASILPFGGSDHWLVQLEATFMGTPRNRLHSALWRFKSLACTAGSHLHGHTEKQTFQGTKMFMLQQKLKHIKSCLKAWNKKEFGDIFKAKRETEQKLQEINQINITEGFTEERQKLTDSLQEEWEDRCLQEEIFWRQQSRIQWIREGERNTQFFHKSTMAHRAHNRITKIKDSQGIELVSHNDMQSILVQHFCNIAKEPLEDRSRFIDHFTQYIP